MAKICIICEKEPQGRAYRVKDDAVIKAIRALKQKLGVAKNNELYVDDACLPTYREKRKGFERNLAFYSAIAVIVFVAVNALPLFYGRFSVSTFIASVFLSAIIVGLAVVNYSAPPIEEPGSQPAAQGSEATTKHETRRAKPAKGKRGKK